MARAGRPRLRHPVLFLGSLLLAAMFVFLNLASVPSEEEITHALQKTTLSEFAFDDATLPQVTQLFLKQLKQADPRMARVKVEFLDMSHARQCSPLTLSLHNVTMAEAMQYTMDVANLRYTVRRGAIFVFPLTSHGKPPLTPSKRVAASFEYWWWQMTNIFAEKRPQKILSKAL